MLDIHSHILPGVDDGAADVETSIKLLDMMYRQGITHVIATPHFYATHQGMEDYTAAVAGAFAALKNASVGLTLPVVSLGSEVHYFRGIGKSRGICDLSLCGSDYLLLELPFGKFDDEVIEDIVNLRAELGLTPIFAHIERYHTCRGFKRILKLISEGDAYAQINASSVMDAAYKRCVYRLIRRGYVAFLATDTHSPDIRPPMMRQALDEIASVLGSDCRDMLLHNGGMLCQQIFRLPDNI